MILNFYCTLNSELCWHFKCDMFIQSFTTRQHCNSNYTGPWYGDSDCVIVCCCVHSFHSVIHHRCNETSDLHGIPAGMESNVAGFGFPREWTYNLAGLPRECLFIYPRDAMLARVIAIATCPSVSLTRAGIVSKRRKLASWFLHHLVAPRL